MIEGHAQVALQRGGGGGRGDKAGGGGRETRALRRCGRVRWAGGEGVWSGGGDWSPQVLPPRALSPGWWGVIWGGEGNAGRCPRGQLELEDALELRVGRLRYWTAGSDPNLGGGSPKGVLVAASARGKQVVASNWSLGLSGLCLQRCPRWAGGWHLASVASCVGCTPSP